MTIAVCLLVGFIVVLWGVRRLRAARLHSSALSRRETTLGQLGTLLRDLENRERSAPRQELAAVRGGTPRQHVWCAPGGEEVFLN